MIEIWKDIEGYEGLYQVSNLGNVKALPKWVGNSPRKERILKPEIDKGGYLCVGLHKNKKVVMKKIHRLVAIAFIPNPLELPQINHLNGKTDNSVSSLEWSTAKHNINHAINNGLISIHGESNGNSKLTEFQVKEIKELKGKFSQKEIAEMFNVSDTTISFIHNNLIWRHLLSD